MTIREIYDKYKEIFILVVEQAGEETGNSSYKNVESILKKYEDDIEQLLEQNPPFDLMITNLIVLLVIDVHGADSLEGELLKKYVDPLFDIYLKKATMSFCSQNGIPVVRKLSWDAMIRKVKKENIDQ